MTDVQTQIDAMQAVLDEIHQRETFNRIDYLEPYIWQGNFLKCSYDNAQTLLMAANRVGKTFIGAANLSYHLTGLYPECWE